MIFKTSEEEVEQKEKAILEIESEIETARNKLSENEADYNKVKDEHSKLSSVLAAKKTAFLNQKGYVTALGKSLETHQKEKERAEGSKAYKHVHPMQFIDIIEMQNELRVYDPAHLFALKKLKWEIVGTRKDVSVVEGLTWDALFEAVPVEVFYIVVNTALYQTSLSKLAFATYNSTDTIRHILCHAGETLSKVVYGETKAEASNSYEVDLSSYEGYDEWSNYRVTELFNNIKIIIEEVNKQNSLPLLKENKMKILLAAKEGSLYSYSQDKIWNRLFRHREALLAKLKDTDESNKESMWELRKLYDKLILREK